MNENNEIICRYQERKDEAIAEYDTSIGKFIINKDNKELITPKGSINGEFEEIIEFNNKVYVIEAKIGHLKKNTVIYECSKDYELIEVYNTNHFDGYKYIDLRYEGMYREENKVTLLISGHIIYRILPKIVDAKTMSYIIVIDDKGLRIDKTMLEEFQMITNMIIKDNHMYLGMNKYVLDVDMDSELVIRYTLLSEEALADIEKTKHVFTDVIDDDEYSMVVFK